MTRSRALTPLLTTGLLLAMAGAGCGSSSSSPLAPTIGTITGITLTVNPPPVGASVQALAVVSLSTGSSAAIATGFTSDTPSVATVTSAGVLTGVSIGDVTISVDYQGFKASKKVRVLPNYSGVFYGTYTLDSCTDTGAFTDTAFCAGFAADWVGYLALNNSLSADLTALGGQFILDPYASLGLGTTTGTISPAGDLTLAGTIVAGTSRGDFRNFTATSPSVGHIAGHFELVWTDTTMTGSAVMSCKIVDLAR